MKGIFIGGRGYHMTEVSPNAVTMSREEREICRMTGCSIAAFTKARAKRLSGIDPVTGKAIPDVTAQPGLAPFPSEDVGDGEDDPDDDPVERALRTAPMRVRFPATITERHPDGRITRRKAER
ncbi:MAG TPA: hypothetical protein VMV27_00710 [Candidatus Binataceae bacterium]|nr:hypothetical protein [Candidatus Binataceae bacterium]